MNQIYKTDSNFTNQYTVKEINILIHHFEQIKIKLYKNYIINKNYK